MTDVPLKHHGLEAFLQANLTDREQSASIQVSIFAEYGHLNLRGDSNSHSFLTAVEALLQHELPVEANTVVADGQHRTYWLGPDEWLIVTQDGNIAAKSKELLAAVQRQGGVLNELSGGQILLRLSGDGVEQLLAKGCSLDLHKDVFPDGSCAQSGLAKANVLIARADSGDTFDVIVRRSFSDYLLKWLAHAGRDVGIDFCAE